MFTLRSIAIACQRTVAMSTISAASALGLSLLALPAGAQTVLKAGEAAVVSLRSDTPDAVSLLLLRAVEAGTEIRITDNGWKSGGGFRANEGVVVWTAVDALAAGTVIQLTGLDKVATAAASVGKVVGSSSFNLASGGDSVLVYQGSDATPQFLFGVNNTADGQWQADAADANTSALPPGLTNGVTALALVKKDNYAYTKGATTGSAAALLAAIAAPANWAGDDAVVPDAPSAFTVTAVVAATALYQPAPSTAQGSSDASAAIALDDDYMVVGDDEGNVLRVYPRGGGVAVKEWEFGSLLGISKELDLEAATHIGDTWYFIGSHSNKSDGTEADNREHLFAAQVTGTGATTVFTYKGQYAGLEGALAGWDTANTHGKGAGYFGMAASAAGGVLPEGNNGFSIEGMAATSSGQLLLGMRAPLASMAVRRNALIVPIANPAALMAGATPVFGAPIELNLGGRGIRDMQQTEDGQYLIIAGPPGKADSAITTNFALYVWAGPGTTTVVQLDNALDALLAETGGSFETLVSPVSTAPGTRIQLLQDNGDTVWPGKSKVSKDLPFAEQQFKGNWITLGQPVAADTQPPQLQSTVPLNNAAQVGKGTPISFQFNEAIALGSGSIQVVEAGKEIATIAMTNSQVSIAGASLHLKLSQALLPGKAYEIRLPAAAVVDMAGNALATAQSLKFTTSDATAAVAQLLITEVNSNADGGDFFELYNWGATPVDLSGWQWTDSSAKDYGKFPAGQVLAAGARLVVLNETTPTVFQQAWGLADARQVVQVTGPGLGKGDAVLVYDANGYVATAMNYSATAIKALDGSTVAPAADTAGVAVTGSSHAGPAMRGTGATVGDGVSAVWDGKSTSVPRYVPAKVNELEAFAQPGNAAFIGSPGKVKDSTTPPVAATTRISAIQGSGAASPLKGQSVTVRGIVTAYLPNLQGFNIQSVPEDDDGNPATSEGVFAYFGSTALAGMDAGAVGKTVQFTATVDEYKEQTQLSRITNFSQLNGGAVSALPAPVTLSLPISDMALWERYEGMRVRIVADQGPLVVTDNFALGRFGTVTLSSGGLLAQYTELNAPNVDGNKAYLAAQQRNQIILDDASGKQNPDAVTGRNGAPLSASNTLRAGDTTTAIEGVLDQFVDPLAGAHQTSYRLQPSQPVVFAGAERPTVNTLKQAVGQATVKIASANVLNFFTSLGSKNFSNPFGDVQAGRGADDNAELVRQRDKIVANLVGLGADVYGIMEMQNNGFGADSALAAMVAAMNQQQGSEVFAYVKGPFSTGGDQTVVAAGHDAITVALIYRQGYVRPVGKAAVPDERQYDAFNATYGNRVPLAQSFEVSLADGTAEQFTVVVNHLKSKGSVNDPDTGDGQGANNQARLRAVNQLHTWLAGTPTQIASDKLVLLGDFNAYAKEDPITYLEAQGYQKLAPGQYSYGFQGLWGALDHVLVSQALAPKVGNAVKWHINAEEPPVLDYNTNYKTPAQVIAFYAADAYRSSDHNPIVLGLNLDKAPTEPAQAYVVQLPSGGSATVGLTSAAQCKLDGAPMAVNPAALGALPKGVTLPYQALQWSASGCAPGGSASLSVTYPDPLPANTQYWKWGPTASQQQPHWYSLPAVVNGRVLTVQLVDGADGDDDLTVNGKIADPGGAGWLAAGPVDPGTGAGTVTAVPTLSLSGLMGLSGLLAMAAAWLRRRKPRR